jgi:hypothetical protein
MLLQLEKKDIRKIRLFFLAPQVIIMKLNINATNAAIYFGNQRKLQYLLKIIFYQYSTDEKTRKRTKMIIQIKVKVKQESLKEFAEKLMRGQLDRSAIISETYCEKDNPAVGISYWNVADMDEFETKFSLWKPFYDTVETAQMITAKEAMTALFNKRD